MSFAAVQSNPEPVNWLAPDGVAKDFTINTYSNCA